jgi:hypothetical protein
VRKTELIKEAMKQIGGIYLYVDNTKSSNLLLLQFSSIIKEYFVVFSKSGFNCNMKDIPKINNIILFDLKKMQEIIEN